MAKIGILGGTFNPIHVGHLILAQECKEQLSLDEIWVMPSGISYLKKDQQIPSGKTRLHMVSLAIENTEGFLASDYEIGREGNTYTYETLEGLTKEYPQHTFYFIVGGDSLYSLDSWYHPEIILQKCILVAGARDQHGKEELQEIAQKLTNQYGGKIELIDFPNIEISSTSIREKVATHKSIHHLVPTSLEEYILASGLYRA